MGKIRRERKWFVVILAKCQVGNRRRKERDGRREVIDQAKRFNIRREV